MKYQPSDMSFSVKCERTGLEYGSAGLSKVFVQRRNVLRPRFLKMLTEIVKFGKKARELIESGDDRITLADYVKAEGYSETFIEHYLIPVGAAVWSADPTQFLRFPARSFVQFFHNHGFLNLVDRPTWQVIEGGSRVYAEKLTAPYREAIRLNEPVTGIERRADGVIVRSKSGEAWFDEVVIAVHSDTALRMLSDPSAEEREILGAIPYQENVAVLHTDDRILPKARGAWSAWNYHRLEQETTDVCVTYNMNILQSLDAPKTFCVTLNPKFELDERKVIRRITYHHPVFTPEGVAAQKRHGEISGVRRTHYCGAYWGWGFHEDGVNSALAALKAFDVRLPQCTAASIAA